MLDDLVFGADAQPSEPATAELGCRNRQTIAGTPIMYRQLLDEHAHLHGPLPAWAEPDYLHTLYQAMLSTRLFDQQVVALQRTGQLGTYGACYGQEAVAIGTASAMAADDVLFPTYREQGAYFWRGLRMHELLLFWGGDERGMAGVDASDASVASRHDFPLCIPIATQMTHAAGVAWALLRHGEGQVAVAFIGDGGTSKGDFYEALNLAGLWQLPLVVVICNNQWAISVPRSAQSHSCTLAQKAVAADIATEQLDGNDILIVHERLQAAIAKARAGGGPTVVEALTYRLADHTTADDASRYRRPDEWQQQQGKEPLLRVQQLLQQRFGWTEEQQEALEQQIQQEVNAEVQRYLHIIESAPVAPEAMFEHLYAQLPVSLQAQRQQLGR